MISSAKLKYGLMWIALLSILLAALSLMSAIILSPSFSLRDQHYPYEEQPFHQNEYHNEQYHKQQQLQQQQQRQHRSLEEVDGVTACKSCSGAGKKCVGRTVSDDACDACSSGQSFWPCNLSKECWCWDTALPRDPGDEDDKDRACSGCGRGGDTEVCVSNQNSLVPVGDEECNKCMEGQSFWPCDDPDLCWCWDTTKPKKPPAPASGLSVATDIDPNVPAPCEILTKAKFDVLAPNSTFPYTYEGLCNAIDDYNEFHTEKFAAMGTEELIRAELAAFLGNTAHESDDFEAAREYLACGDRKEVDGKVYCKPCNNDLYDWKKNVCSVSMVDQNAPYNSYCQPSFEPPEGCVCDTITQVEESGPLAGYVEASKVFYGRGAIQLSWNYNYIRASYSLTGSAETFCNDPEQVATTPEYAWGSGIYFWMENQKEGSTCHKEALKGDFGGTLNNINGGLECPAYKGGWHADAIKMRLNRYCHAAYELNMPALSDLRGCKGMMESYEECLGDGHCPYCKKYYDGVPTQNFTNVEMPDPIAKPVPKPVPALEPEPEPAVEEPAETPESTAKPTPTPISDEPTPAPVAAAVVTFTFAPTPGPVASATETLQPTLLSTLTMAEPEPSPTEPPSSKEASQPISESQTGSPTTPNPTSPPPSTNKPSKSPIAEPTATPTTGSPSYKPTTPQPTMGPCDGEVCPGEMCRSPYGFCGSGPAYCSDTSIWSPSCRENSEYPTSRPTKLGTEVPSKSPVEKATPILDGVFDVTRKPTLVPVAGEGGFGAFTDQPVSSAGVSTGAGAFTPQPISYPAMEKDPSRSPTKKPFANGGTFSKPSGGKNKPTGGKPGSKPSSLASSSGKPGAKPSPTNSGSSSQAADTAGKFPDNNSVLQTADNMPQVVSWITIAPTQLPVTPSPITAAPTPLPVTASPTLRPTEKVWSPTDPEATYFCGVDWADANTGCGIRCPSSKSEDCPVGHKCFAFTSCMETTRPTKSVTPRPTGLLGLTVPTSSANEDWEKEDEAEAVTAPNMPGMPEGCTGTPCPFAGECRSQYGFCGTSFIYCNSLSVWEFERCGLAGFDEDGEQVLCDAETKRCEDGKEEVVRNPAAGCEYFPCPEAEEDEDEGFFVVPVPSPSSKFPELPKPTLPTIDKPTPFTLPTVVKPSGIVIDLDKKPSRSNDTVAAIASKNDEVASDDGEEESDKKGSGDEEEKEDGDKPKPASLTEFDSFSPQEWLANSADVGQHSARILVSITIPLMAIILVM